MTLSGRILVGLVAGIATGLFLGELAADLAILGDIFIQLLQITVLPYIVASLISGIGRLDLAQARQLAIRGAVVLLAIWGMALAVVYAGALAFPDIEAAAFFSADPRVDPGQPDLLALYLPANIFYSLTNNLVPAVVLFSVLLGVALIGLEEKASVLAIFDGIAQAMSRINQLVVQLTPYGIFAIAAAAAGTMTVDELERVQVYLVTYVALALLVTFWLFPGLIAAASGLPFREVLTAFRDPLVTAFATGNQFVVLPQIAENCKALLRRHALANTESESAVDVLVPVSFNFPSLGKLMVLLFVLFAAWFTDTDLNVWDRLSLATGGLFSLFGSINVAVPYMLDSLHIPADMFQLFLVTGIVVGRFGAMLAALHIVVLSVLGALAMTGRLQLKPRALLRYVLLALCSLALLVIALRAYFNLFVPAAPAREQVLAEVELSAPHLDAPILAPGSAPLLPPVGPRIDHVRDSGTLRVGFRPANLPCSFVTPGGRLVGFDVEMAHLLADDLGVSLEFVPFQYPRLGQMLDSGEIDIAMSCIISYPDRASVASFSRPYLDMSLAMVVRDHHRDQYADLEHLRQLPDLTVALVANHYFESRLRRLLPDAEVVVLESAESFFSDPLHGASALLLTREEGAAYAYRYPEFTVVDTARQVALPAAYALPRGDQLSREFVDNWIELKRLDGTLDALYGYWMLGGAADRREPRWSIIRNVLGWLGDDGSAGGD